MKNRSMAKNKELKVKSQETPQMKESVKRKRVIRWFGLLARGLTAGVILTLGTRPLKYINWACE